MLHFGKFIHIILMIKRVQNVSKYSVNGLHY